MTMTIQEMEYFINELKLLQNELKLLQNKLINAPDTKQAIVTRICDLVAARVAKMEKGIVEKENQKKIEQMVCHTRGFTETEDEHAHRLYETLDGKISSAISQYTVSCRQILRMRQRAQQANHGLITDSAIRKLLGAEYEYRPKIAAMSIEELEHELEIQWDNQMECYKPA